jgi:hypothetical protein
MFICRIRVLEVRGNLLRPWVWGSEWSPRKWMHFFDHVPVILFCVAISDYDQLVIENGNKSEERVSGFLFLGCDLSDPGVQNRLAESIGLLKSIVNTRPWFRRTPIILLLNKLDLFREKLARVRVQSHFLSSYILCIRRLYVMSRYLLSYIFPTILVVKTSVQRSDTSSSNSGRW